MGAEWKKIPKKEQAAYDKGFREGKNEGYLRGIEVGREELRQEFAKLLLGLHNDKEYGE